MVTTEDAIDDDEAVVDVCGTADEDAMDEEEAMIDEEDTADEDAMDDEEALVDEGEAADEDEGDRLYMPILQEPPHISDLAPVHA